MKLENRTIDEKSLIVAGVDKKDYPDFCDAYFVMAAFSDGENLLEHQLDALGAEYPEVLNQMAHAVCVEKL